MHKVRFIPFSYNFPTVFLHFSCNFLRFSYHCPTVLLPLSYHFPTTFLQLFYDLPITILQFSYHFPTASPERRVCRVFEIFGGRVMHRASGSHPSHALRTCQLCVAWGALKVAMLKLLICNTQLAYCFCLWVSCFFAHRIWTCL